MSAENSTAGNPPKLDEETERLIKDLEDAATFDFGRDGFTSKARNALRQQITRLVEEARREGYESDKHFRMKEKQR